MNIALITSTISPDPGVIALQRSNVNLRLEDYKAAFKFYCEKLKEKVFDKLIYVDNSGYSLDQLIAIAINTGVDKDCEFISYLSTVDPNNNRLYLEANLIDHFINSSEILNKSCSVADCKIWKITGRYIITNIRKIISGCSDGNFDLCLQYRDYPQRMVDFYLVGFSLDAYIKLISNNINMFKGKINGELILRRHLDAGYASEFHVIKRFKVVPRIVGFRAYDGARYGGIKDTLKYYLRAMVNNIAPFIWI
jgi:hypothetical protein